MSTRRSLLVTGVLTAALSVVGFVDGAGAQTASLVAAFSPTSIDEPATGAGAAPKSTLTVTLTNTGTRGIVLIPQGDTVLSVEAMATYGGTAATTGDYTVAATAGSGTVYAAGLITFQRPSAGTTTLTDGSVLLAADKTLVGKLDLTSVHDTLPEGDETVAVTVEIAADDIVYAAAGATASVGVTTTAAAPLRNAAILTITDNDNPGVSTLTSKVSGMSLKESDAKDRTKSVVDVTVSTDSGTTFTTDQRIQLELGGDATEGEDYTIDKKVLTLEAGDTMVKATITVVDDMVYDGRVDETINVTAYVDSVRLSGGMNGTHTIRIEDNDQNPEDFEVSVDPMMIMEGEVATLTVTAMDNVTSARTFMLTLAGTATENSDYTMPSELMIPKDTKTGSVQLQAVMDGAAEMDETVMITVMAGGVMIGSVQTVTITGDADAADPPDEPEEDETDEPEEDETDESEEEMVRLPKVEYTATAGDASIMVSWTAVEGAARYEVGWSKDTQAETANTHFTVRDGKLSYMIENLANGTAYAVWVNAVDEDGNWGEGSRPVVVTPMAAAEMPTPTPALPLFGAFALGAGLLAAGRARVRRQAQLRGREQRQQLTR